MNIQYDRKCKIVNVNERYYKYLFYKIFYKKKSKNMYSVKPTLSSYSGKIYCNICVDVILLAAVFMNYVRSHFYKCNILQEKNM